MELIIFLSVVGMLALGGIIWNVFAKPNDQSETRFSFGMARKGGMKSNLIDMHNETKHIGAVWINNENENVNVSNDQTGKAGGVCQEDVEHGLATGTGRSPRRTRIAWCPWFAKHVRWLIKRLITEDNETETNECKKTLSKSEVAERKQEQIVP